MPGAFGVSTDDSKAVTTEPQDEARRRIALLLEYDGGAFAGSQLQKNARTVQAVLEDAIERVTGEKARAAFAGRTDAGVHACGQVASFVTASSLPVATLLRALNAWLPADVAVRDAEEVALDFDVRRDARRRHYRYLVENSSVRPVLDRDRVWQVTPPLDIEAMAVAAARLIGRHDFAAFASAPEGGGSTVREVYGFEVSADASRVRLDVTANAFLPHQVRRMAGALVEVGKGRRSAWDFAVLLAGPPASAGPAAPARGLYLMEVEYDEALFGTRAGKAFVARQALVRV